MIKLTNTRRGGNVDPVYINPRYIKRISVAANGETVVEVDGSEYASWCRETPDEVYDLIARDSRRYVALPDDELGPVRDDTPEED